MLRVFPPVACGVLLASVCEAPFGLLVGAWALCGLCTIFFRSDIYLLATLLLAGWCAAEAGRGGMEPPRDCPVLLRLQLREEPRVRERSAAVDAEVEAWCDGAGRWHAAGCRVRLRADSTWQPQAGERVSLIGRIREFAPRDSFFASLMHRRGFVGRLFVGERNLLLRERSDGAGPLAGRIHREAVRRLDRLRLSPDSRAVVQAMAAGERRYLTPELREAYARSGTAHLLAVSGLHVGVVFLGVNALLWLLPLMRRGHRIRSLVAVPLVWLYAFVTGCPPSVLRAALMFSALQFALASGNRYVAMNLLGGVATVLVLLQPDLLYDIGFQLSFIAVAAILCGAVPLVRPIRGGALRWLAGTLAAGLCASAAVAPLIAFRFGSVSFVGAAVNPFAALTAQAIVGGAVLWLCLPFEGLRPGVEGWLEGVVRFQNAAVEAVAGWEHAACELSLTAGQTAAIYLFFVVATLFGWSLERKKSVFLRP